MSDRTLFRVAVFLAVVGCASAALRYVLPFDLHVAVTTPLFGSYATEQLAVLREHPAYEHAHRLGGSAWMLLGLAQLVPGLRARRPAVHRWFGRAFVGLSIIVGLGGAAMGVLFPYSPGERLPAALAGVWMALTAAVGIRAAWARAWEAHRAWMIRCLAVGLGVSTIRLFAVALTLTTSIPTRDIVGPTFWAGWVLTVAAAEVWLRAPAWRGAELRRA